MDASSSYLLKIRIIGNPKKVRKDVTCFLFEKVVDSDTTNFKDFIESIVNQYPPGYQEVVHVHYYDSYLAAFPEVKTDQELLSMFQKHTENKVVDMAITYNDPLEPYIPITKWPGASDVDSDFTCDPKQKQPMNKGKQPMNKGKPEPEDENCPNPLLENEYVDIDEESTYLGKEHADDVPSKGEDKDADYVVEEDSDSGSDSEMDDENEVEGMEPIDADYDKNDPPMHVGMTYPNIQVFKLALAQHAIKHEFEYNTEKSDKGRFRAYCTRKQEDNCPWRLHASTMDDKQTIKVIAECSLL